MPNKYKWLSCLIVGAALFLLSSTALAQSMEVGMMHMPVSKAVGQGAATTTIYIYTRAGSPLTPYVVVDATASDPTKLRVIAYHKNGANDFATSSCVHRGMGFHRCPVTILAGADPRTVNYFLGAIASTSPSIVAYMPNNTLAAASTSPFNLTVQNTALGAGQIAGKTVFAQSLSVATNIAAATTVPITADPVTYTSYAIAAIAPNDFLYINGSTTVVRVIATSASALIVSDPVSLAAGTQLHKLMGGIDVFAEGTVHFASSTGAGTSTGSYTLSNMVAGSYNLVAFKEGLCDVMPPAVFTGNSNNIIYISAGCGFSGSMESFMVVWTAPGDSMMGAPREIAFDRNNMANTRAPILIGLSQTASSTTISTSTVLLKRVVSGQTQVVTSTAVHYYNPSDATTFCSGGNCLGPDGKIILYSGTPLLPDSQYIVELTSGVQSANGNPLQGNRSAGGHTFMFTTSQDMSSMSQGQYGQGGAFMPPFITGMLPMTGSFGVARDSNVLVMFSEPMDSTSITTASIQLCKVTSAFTSLESEDCTVAASISLDSNTKKIVTVNPTSNLDASSRYRVKVFGSCRSAAGISIAPPDQPTMVNFKGDFETGTSLDAGSPSVMGTNLMKYYSGGNYTNVPVSSLFEVNFSEGMDPSTITKTTMYVRLAGASSNVNGIVEYDPFANKARFVLSEVLQVNASYSLNLATTVQDLAAKYLDGDTSTGGIQAYVLNFTTTATGDTSGPQLIILNADNYLAEVDFSEPVIAVSMTDAKWASSSLNISNYTIKYGAAGTGFGANCASAGTAADVSLAKLNYDAGKMKVKIENILAAGALSLTAGNEMCVYAQNVIDLSNNDVSASADTLTAVMQNHQTTYGMFGGSGMMMGPPSSAGGMMGPMIGVNDPSQMGMMPMSANPMNAMANLSTNYFIDLPTAKALENGSFIVLDFQKQGFNVANAIPDPYSPVRTDWNGPGNGVVTLNATYDTDGVAVDTTLETITLKLAITGTPNAIEFYHFDLSNIVNAQANTTGYTVKIITKNAAGTVLETKTSMPFFISQAGARTVTIGINAIASTSATIKVATSTVKVMLGSPMTGPMEGTVTYDTTGRSASTSFTGLVDGDYFVFTKPSFDLAVCDDAGCTATTSKSFVGIASPDPIRVSGSDVSRSLSVNKENLSSSTPVVIWLKGNFGTDEIDVFAGSPNNGYVKKKLSSLGNLANFTQKTTMYLPANGNWRIGIGPAAPEGMAMGPVPMPSWMPPADIMVTASTSGGVNQCIEDSGTSSDCGLNFEIKVATNKIIGYVKDSSGAAITDASVEAHKTLGMGMPSHAQTDATGRFELKVALGSGNAPETYGLNVFKPGLPPAGNKTVVVCQDNKNPAGAADVLSDDNNTANVYVDGSMPVTTALPLNLIVEKGGYTISGKVYDDTSSDAKTVAKAPVWANNTATGEFVPSGTDNAGFYVLYVKPGTWKVQAQTPELGVLAPVTVVVTNVNQSVNLKPGVAKSSMYAISGNTGSGATLLTGVQVWIEGTTDLGQRFDNGTVSDSNGAYSLKVPSGAYRLHARHPNFGEYLVVNLGAVAANVAQNLTPPSTSEFTTLYFKFTNAPGSSTRAFVDVFNPTTNIGNGAEISAISSATCTETIKIKTTGGAGLMIKAMIPGFGAYEPVDTAGYSAVTHKVTIADGTASKTITFTLPTAGNQVLVTGNVSSSAGVVADAMVGIGSLTSGFFFNGVTDSLGNYSLRVPAGSYRMGVDKPGYGGVTPVDLNLTTSTARDFLLAINANYISGTITSNGTAAVQGAWVWAEKVNSATDFSPAGGWAGSQTDANGSYKLSVGSGYWLVRSKADGYRETKNTSAVAAGGNPAVNLTLLADANYTVKEPKQQSIIPSQGGVFDDSTGDTRTKITIPSNFKDDTNQGKVIVRETASVPSTDSKKPLGGKGKEINIYDSNNSAIRGSATTSSTGASGNTIGLEIYYSESDVTAAGMTEDQLVLGYWNESTNEWQAVDAVVDKDNNVIRANTSHFSVYAPLLPVGINPPSVPGTPLGTLTSNDIAVSWTSSTDDTSVAGYEVYRSTTADGTFSNVSGDSWSTGSFISGTLTNSCTAGTCTWNDSNKPNGTYYYKVAAFDNEGNYSSSTAASVVVTVGTNSSSGTSGAGAAVVGGGAEINRGTSTTTATTTSATTTATTGAPSKPLSQMNKAELEAEVQRLVNLIKQLQEQLNAMIQQQGGITGKIMFKLTLKLKDKGDGVTLLQQCLAKDKQIYPEALVTGNFGPLTKKAVIRFQERFRDEVLKPFGLSKGTGLVAAKTRAKLNIWCNQ